MESFCGKSAWTLTFLNFLVSPALDNWNSDCCRSLPTEIIYSNWCLVMKSKLQSVEWTSLQNGRLISTSLHFFYALMWYFVHRVKMKIWHSVMSEENRLWIDAQGFCCSRSSDSLRSLRFILFPALLCKHSAGWAVTLFSVSDHYYALLLKQIREPRHFSVRVIHQFHSHHWCWSLDQQRIGNCPPKCALFLRLWWKITKPAHPGFLCYGLGVCGWKAAWNKGTLGL